MHRTRQDNALPEDRDSKRGCKSFQEAFSKSPNPHCSGSTLKMGTSKLAHEPSKV